MIFPIDNSNALSSTLRQRWRAIRWHIGLAIALTASSTTAFDLERWIQVKGGAWEPTSQNLTQLEVALRPAARVAAEKRGHNHPWNQYTFQYQGRSSLLGHKYIYVNAFCRIDSRTLNTEWVVVYDGGACYFSAKYDLAEQRIYGIEVNGIG